MTDSTSTTTSLTSNERGFPISIRLDTSVESYNLMTEEQRDQFLADYEAVLAEHGFETDARWNGGLNVTEVEGRDTYHGDAIEESYPGLLDAMEAAWNEAVSKVRK